MSTYTTAEDNAINTILLWPSTLFILWKSTPEAKWKQNTIKHFLSVNEKLNRLFLRYLHPSLVSGIVCLLASHNIVISHTYNPVDQQTSIQVLPVCSDYFLTNFKKCKRICLQLCIFLCLFTDFSVIYFELYFLLETVYSLDLIG